MNGLPPAAADDAGGGGAAALDAVHWDARPIALLSDKRLRAVSAAAGRAGVRAGMTVAEARARCAGLIVRPWDDAIIAREITRTTGALLEASPQVTPVAGAPGLWWVGAHGFDGLGGERTLLALLRRIARRAHPRARVAAADSCVAARAATWASAANGLDVCLVPPGGCAAYLAPAPLTLLPMEPEMRQALIALGIRTIGALAALEPGEVERRWGSAGLGVWRLARGEDRRRPVLARVAARHAVSAELPAPVTTIEPVLFLVRPALERLTSDLVREGRAVAAIAITLELDVPGSALPAGGRPHTVTREVRPARPLARAGALFERCRVMLERWRLDAPICGVSVAIAASAPLAGEQGALLEGTWRDPAAVDLALARLRAELGPGAVVRPVARDADIPERQGGWTEIEDAGPPLVPKPRVHDGREGERRDPAVPSSGIHGGNGSHGGQSDAGAQALRSPDGAERQGARTSDGPAGVRPAHPPSPRPHLAMVPDDDPPVEPALRLLESPEPLDVECRAGTPHLLRWRGRRIPLAGATGPERLTGGWWKSPAERYARDYWRCEESPSSGTGGGVHFLVFREGSEGEWYMQGWYD